MVMNTRLRHCGHDCEIIFTLKGDILWNYCLFPLACHKALRRNAPSLPCFEPWWLSSPYLSQILAADDARRSLVLSPYLDQVTWVCFFMDTKGNDSLFLSLCIEVANLDKRITNMSTRSMKCRPAATAAADDDDRRWWLARVHLQLPCIYTTLSNSEWRHLAITQFLLLICRKTPGRRIQTQACTAPLH